jgi:mevalonate kinase
MFDTLIFMKCHTCSEEPVRRFVDQPLNIMVFALFLLVSQLCFHLLPTQFVTNILISSSNSQVSSSVPEGKGVSSSASVEVATMSAIAAAYG